MYAYMCVCVCVCGCVGVCVSVCDIYTKIILLLTFLLTHLAMYIACIYKHVIWNISRAKMWKHLVYMLPNVYMPNIQAIGELHILEMFFGNYLCIMKCCRCV